MTEKPGRFMFGIYPFHAVGTVDGVAVGPPDDFKRLPAIVDELRGDRPLLLRAYVPYAGDESLPMAQSMLKMFAASGAPWDVVLSFRQEGDDLAGWLRLITQIVSQHGRSLDTLQITGEPNLVGLPGSGDGARMHVRRALRQGVLAARSAASASGATVSIGFNAVPTFNVGDDFWPDVHGFGNDFRNAIDYVGLDIYPDAFGPPIQPEHLATAVQQLVRTFRERDLVAGGIPASVPIRICENGWHTAAGRSYERQAAALETIIRAIHAVRVDLNVTHYELFNLRDADSSRDESFYQFGILRDDYTPKPAFAVYQRLIRELTTWGTF